MENLKLKYQALQAYLESKFIVVSKHLAKHFFAYLAIILLPPLILGVALCHQTSEVQEATKQPLLTKKEVKRLEAQVSKSQEQVKHFRGVADSLGRLGDKKEKLTSKYQQSADSLKSLHDQVPTSTASAAELTSYLTNYHPQEYSDSL